MPSSSSGGFPILGGAARPGVYNFRRTAATTPLVFLILRYKFQIPADLAVARLLSHSSLWRRLFSSFSFPHGPRTFFRCRPASKATIIMYYRYEESRCSRSPPPPSRPPLHLFHSFRPWGAMFAENKKDALPHSSPHSRSSLVAFPTRVCFSLSSGKQNTKIIIHSNNQFSPTSVPTFLHVFECAHQHSSEYYFFIFFEVFGMIQIDVIITRSRLHMCA